MTVDQARYYRLTNSAADKFTRGGHTFNADVKVESVSAVVTDSFYADIINNILFLTADLGPSINA